MWHPIPWLKLTSSYFQELWMSCEFAIILDIPVYEQVYSLSEFQ